MRLNYILEIKLQNQCINFLLDSNATISTSTEGRSSQVPQYLGTWDYHVNSWINQKELPILDLRYEDLLSSPKEVQSAKEF